VHFHDIDILPLMSILSLWKHVVYDVHEDYPEEMLIREWVPSLLRKPFSKMLEIGQRVFSRPIRNIVLTQTQLDPEFPGTRFRKILILNFASTTLLASVADDYLERPPTVIFIGSQHKNNGSDLLLEIAERVQAVRPGVRFLSSDRFSSPEARQNAVSEIERRQLRNFELIANVRPHELMKPLNRATIAISPNLRVKQQINGAHNKTYEFMAAGIPIVASDLPQQVAVIGGANCGALAQPEDPDSFVRAITRLVDDPAMARQLGINGQTAFRERYSWESQMPRLLDLYSTILSPS